MKFKVGDKVEFLGTDRSVNKNYVKGSLWVIQDIDATNYYLKGEYGYWDKDIFEKEFKLAEVGTLKELNVKPGDVVTALKYSDGDCVEKRLEGVHWTIYPSHPKGYCSCICAIYSEDFGVGYSRIDEFMIFRIVSRAADANPKLWKDMTPEEKGALLLAHHEGKVIEWTGYLGSEFTMDSTKGNPVWCGTHAYRVPPEPKVETVTTNGTWTRAGQKPKTQYVYELTFNVVDGHPDWTTAKVVGK